MTTIDYALSVSTQLLNDGKLEQTESVLNTILEINPTHAFALHLAGIHAYQIGKLTKAIELIQKAITSNSSVALFHSNLGEMYRQSKELLLSIQYGQNAISLDPNSANALSNLGIAYYDAQQYEEALNCHKRALDINPTLASSLNNMGSIYKALENTEQSIAYYKAAIAASPSFAEPFNNIATVYLKLQKFQQAYTYLNQALKLLPNFADAECNMGLALLGLEKYNDALRHFDKALQLKSQYAEAYYGISKVYLNFQHFIESEQYIRKAITLKPKQAEFYQLLAEIYHEQGKNAQALMYLEHALSIDSTLTNLHISKGKMLMEMGEASKAEIQFANALEDPNIETRLHALYSLVQLRKTEPQNKHLQALSSIANRIQDVSDNKQEYVYFALGKCYDDLGEYEKAFMYFSKGCNLKRKKITYNIAEQAHLTNQIIKHFTKDTLEYLRTFANQSSLPIFIVGMPRSGTTLVEQIISSHAKVHGAGELKYLVNLIQQTKINYPENILNLTAANCNVITENYLSYLTFFSNDAAHVVDKMPNNFLVLGIIHALFPQAKIIHVKRNPIDTLLSCYTKLFSEGQYFSYDLNELGQYYHCYETIMNHWQNILPPDAWLDIQYETLIHDFESEAKRMLFYCGLNWDPACLNFHESKRNVRTASFMQVRQPVYTSSVNRWRRFEKELAPLIKFLNQAGVQSVDQQQT